MAEYQTVFDGSAFDPKSWSFFLIPIGITFIGLILVTMPKTLDKLPLNMKGPALRVFSWFYFLFALTLTSISLYVQISKYLEIRQAIADHNYHVAEGPVTQFTAMPVTGHADEIVTVQGVTFRYSDYNLTKGFNNTESHGGPIHANSHVRLSYLCKPSETDCSDPIIIKAEIRKPA